ncbi:ABC transporter ATP-binding protein [Anaeromassilibacillus sp. 1001302B_160321_C8]|uniref:ABC transporter ATP-binding protein n=1 Tax=Anaeromassilibacillus sp. 1001302B_160321_C8 TaxID=2787132 RepID=UPI00189A0868|nr:ABC transporter ATP-binding protein [Anaeromassilibacillus sp. 1001302B_160321_C8]
MKKSGINKSVLKRLLRYAKPHAGFLLLALVSAIINVSLTLYGPILVGRAIDYVIGPDQVDFAAMVPVLITLAVTIVVSAAFQWLMTYCTNRVSYKTVRDLRIQTYEKINTLPLKYIDGHAHGDLISRIVNDVDQVSDGLLQGITQLFTGVVTIVGTLLFMLTISPVITVVVVLVTPLSLFVAAFIARLTHRQFVEQQATQGELSGFVEEMIGGQKTVKTFHYEGRAEERFKEINGRLYDCGVKAQFYSSLSNPSTRFVNNMVYTAVAAFGAVCAITGWPAPLTIGQISSFLTYANQYTKPFNEVTGVLTQIQTAFASAERLFAVLDEESERPDAPDAAVLEHCKGDVAVEHLYFSYDPARKLIEDMNIAAKSGSRIAIVGPTGCGKTTIINLLMRFYDADRGSISVDGHNIQSVTRNSLRKQYGMVLQESWLFSGTVRENIAYGREDASLEEVVAAAKKAHAHSFILRLPQGYDTVISEDGGNLSQGQRQLLCIARVMLVDPPMLILDEATSSIDTRTEWKIQTAFEEMMRGRTSFIVAHRLSTIKGADLILVMNQGRIVEQGTHESLLAKGGFYANLYNSQFAVS